MRRTLVFLAVFPLIAASAIAAGDPQIADFRAHEAAGDVGIHLSLQNAFADGDLEKALRSGLATGFTYYVSLVRKRPNWFDDTLTSSRIDVIATFNSVTQEYLLNYRRDRKLVGSETFSDIDSLKKRMTTIDEEKLFRVGRYRPQKLVVRAKADVMSGYLFYIIPWEFSTSWEETRLKSVR
jgi:hypothetical protein